MFTLPGNNNVVKRLAESSHDNYHRDVDTAVVTQMRKEFWVNVERRILSVIDNNFKALIDPILGEEREEKVTPNKTMAREILIYESVLKELNFEMVTFEDSGE